MSGHTSGLSGDTAPGCESDGAWLFGGDRRLLMGCALLTLGLAFFWSLIRHAGIANLVSLVGLTDARQGALLLYYVLLAVSSGVVARGIDGSAKRRRRSLAFTCLLVGVLTCALVAVGGFAFAHGMPPWCAWVAVAIAALSTGLLAVQGVLLCGSVARADRRVLLACVLASVLASIVVTFVFSDVFGMGDAVAALYPPLAGSCLCAAGLMFGDGVGDGSDHFDFLWPAAARNAFWVRGRAASLVGVLVLATLLKALADLAFLDEGLRMVKHLVGILELSLILVAVNAIRGVAAPSIISYYTLLGGLLAGTALACAPFPAAVVHVGVATITTARVLAEALVLAYAADVVANGSTSLFRAAFLSFVFPEMLACVVGYGVLPAVTGALGADLVVLFCGFGALVVAGMGAFALSVVGSHELLAIGEGGRRTEDADSDSVVESAEAAARRLASCYALTEREIQIAAYLLQGCSVRGIASAESVSVNTVQSHSRNLYRKLGVHSRQELADLACDLGDPA